MLAWHKPSTFGFQRWCDEIKKGARYDNPIRLTEGHDRSSNQLIDQSIEQASKEQDKQVSSENQIAWLLEVRTQDVLNEQERSKE